MSLFKHAETGEVYAIKDIVYHAESMQKFVVYSITTDENKHNWVAPFDLFFSQIEVNGELVSRFIPVE